jgi:hypothetical protein
MDAFYFRVFISEKWFKMLKEDPMQISSQRSRIPSFHPDRIVMPPDAHQCPEVSNSSKLHSSGRHSNVSERLSKFDQKIEFPSQTQIWEDSYIHPDDKATPSERYP